MTIYRDQNRRLHINPRNAGKNREIFHPDDSLDCKTVIHIFKSKPLAQGFLARNRELFSTNMGVSDIERIPNTNSYGIIVEYTDTPEDEREPKTIHH